MPNPDLKWKSVEVLEVSRLGGTAFLENQATATTKISAILNQKRGGAS